MHNLNNIQRNIQRKKRKKEREYKKTSIFGNALK